MHIHCVAVTLWHMCDTITIASGATYVTQRGQNLSVDITTDGTSVTQRGGELN